MGRDRIAELMYLPPLAPNRRVVAGPFYPAGRPNASTSLKGRLDECMMGLCKQLSEDWPTGFLQVRVCVGLGDYMHYG